MKKQLLTYFENKFTYAINVNILENYENYIFTL